MNSTDKYKKVIIIGGIGKGEQIADCINDNRIHFDDYEFEVAGFLNDFETGFIGEYPVLGTLNEINKFIEKDYYFSFAIHPIGKNQAIINLFEKLNIPKNRLATIISKRAFVSSTSVLEPGVAILPFAYVSLHVHIGSCSLIMARTSIGHNSRLGTCCFMGTGSILSSYVTLGNAASIAIGGIVIERCTLENASVLGAGSMLLKDVPENSIFVGNPARFLKNTVSI